MLNALRRPFIAIRRPAGAYRLHESSSYSSSSTTVMSSSASSPQTPLRILMLHGFTQNPTLFHAKTGALYKHLAKSFPHHSVHLSYPGGPHRLAPADIPGFRVEELDAAGESDSLGWWRRKDYAPEQGGMVYEGLEEGMSVIAQRIREEGPFDGVVGFSQGACAAGMVAALLEGASRQGGFERAQADGGIPYPESFLQKQGGDGEEGLGAYGFVQGPLKFAIAYGGFRAPEEKYVGFYEPRISTPVLSVMGAVDVVVDEKRAMTLVDACEEGTRKVVVHPGGHFVPSQKPWLDAVVRFIQECVEGKGYPQRGTEEEVSAEDMDVPF